MFCTECVAHNERPMAGIHVRLVKDKKSTLMLRGGHCGGVALPLRMHRPRGFGRRSRNELPDLATATAVQCSPLRVLVAQGFAWAMGQTFEPMMGPLPGARKASVNPVFHVFCCEWTLTSPRRNSHKTCSGFSPLQENR